MQETELPQDPAELKELVLAAYRELEKNKQTLAVKDQEIAYLQHELKLRIKQIYGRRRERFVGPHQELPFEEPKLNVPSVTIFENMPDEDLEIGEEKDKKRRRPRGITRLSEDFPRETKVLDLDPAAKICKTHHVEMKQIGEVKSSRLKYVPATCVIEETIRPQYACQKCKEGVHMAILPLQIIDDGYASPELLTRILTGKHLEHLPLYRLEQIFKRDGIDIARSTMCTWIGDLADAFVPILEAMKLRLLVSYAIHTDDTPVTMLDKTAKGGSRAARLWVYLGDEGEVIFDFTISRERDGPLKFLNGYIGHIQADAFSGYDVLFREKGCIEVACWAHARRKFKEAQLSDPVRAPQMLSAIRRLYAIERFAKHKKHTFNQREELRRTRAIPVLDAIGRFLEREMPQILPKSPWGKAIGYAYRQWQALRRYAEDGRLAIDNNPAENMIRIVALGRKNWLFAGNAKGGQNAAVIYSLISTCLRNGINPQEYLCDVIARLPGHPKDKMWELTPRGWKEARDAK